MNSLQSLAKVQMSATLAAGFVSAIRIGYSPPIYIFALVFFVGLVIRNSKVFWKLSFTYFAFMSFGSLFFLLGGLEPNKQSIVDTGDWLNFDFFLFLMFTLSWLLAITAGVFAEKTNDATHQD